MFWGKSYGAISSSQNCGLIFQFPLCSAQPYTSSGSKSQRHGLLVLWKNDLFKLGKVRARYKVSKWEFYCSTGMMMVNVLHPFVGCWERTEIVCGLFTQAFPFAVTTPPRPHISKIVLTLIWNTTKLINWIVGKSPCLRNIHFFPDYIAPFDLKTFF